MRELLCQMPSKDVDFYSPVHHPVLRGIIRDNGPEFSVARGAEPDRVKPLLMS